MTPAPPGATRSTKTCTGARAALLGVALEHWDLGHDRPSSGDGVLRAHAPVDPGLARSVVGLSARTHQAGIRHARRQAAVRPLVTVDLVGDQHQRPRLEDWSTPRRWRAG